MKKGVVYLRVSTMNQKEKEISIPSQKEKALKFAEENNIEIVKIFADEGISGSTDKRPEFQKAINFAIKNKIDYFLVYDTSRFARNRVDAPYTKEN